MSENGEQNTIVVKDENGKQKKYFIEGLFDMDDQSYAMLSSPEETVVMRVEGEGGNQVLVGITDPEERDAILDAYDIAINAEPEDRRNTIH